MSQTGWPRNPPTVTTTCDLAGRRLVTRVEVTSRSYHVFAARSREIRGVLPPALATDWFNQSELVLITRQLPEQRFRLMLERLRDLSEKEPEVLELVVKGPSAREHRITSSARIMEFFMTLAPGAGAKFHTADLAMAQWSKYRLQPHVEYLVRNLLFWYVAGLVVWACMPRTGTPSYTRKTAFTVGAYVLGFLAPILEATAIPTTISNVTRLPIFLDKLSACFLEEIGCVVADVMLAGTTWSRMVTMEILEDVPIVIGLVVLWIGVRRVYRVAPLRVVLAVLAGVLVAWGATEAGVTIAAKLLGPTGLV
jgi:hypothetical protein